MIKWCLSLKMGGVSRPHQVNPPQSSFFNGISSYEIHRALKGTQKTAWFMLHRIRLAMQDDTPEKLSGQVEADETLISGKARFMHKSRKEKTLQGGRGSAGKTIVMGLLERGRDKKKSRVQAAVVKNTDRDTLHKEVRQRLETGSELHTDEHSGYVGLEDEYVHEVISHAANEYVRGHVTTNGIENFWTLLKRTIKGSYVSVEPFHLHRYLDEQAFRFNEWGGKDPDRFDHAARTLAGKRLIHKGLTGDPTPA